MAVAVPPRVAARLRACPDGPVAVLHACRDLVHLDLPGGAVAVAAAGVPGLPHALRCGTAGWWWSGPGRGSSGHPLTPYVESGILHLDGRALVAGRLVDVRAPRLDAARIPQTSPVAAQGTPRPRGAGLVAVLEPDVAALPEVRLLDADAVPQLVGHGPGLTPLGDDVLCGWLAAHRAAGVETPAVDDAVRRALDRTSTVSATLLACALAGEVADPVAGYLRALGTPRARAARAALLTLGHTSGAGLAHGVDLALAGLAARRAA